MLSLAHIVHPLALLVQAPSHLLSFAVVAENAAQFSKKNMSAAMTRYVNSSDDEDSEATNKKGTFAVLLASITRFLRVRLGIPHLSEAVVENINCEASQKLITHDFFFPGHWYFRAKPSDVQSKGHTEWVAVVPMLDQDGMIVFREEPLTDPTLLFEDKEAEL